MACIWRHNLQKLMLILVINQFHSGSEVLFVWLPADYWPTFTDTNLFIIIHIIKIISILIIKIHLIKIRIIKA